MKKIILSLAIIAGNSVFSQITLEHSFPDNEEVYAYAKANEMFYVAETTDDKLKIYNADFSLRKIIDVPLPANYTMGFYYNAAEDDLFDISKHVFNTDDKYEFLINAGYYDESTSHYHSKLILINEDGHLLKDFHPNDAILGNYSHTIFHDSSINKNKIAITNIKDNNSFKIDIYSLPTSNLTSREIQSKNKLSAFPIPANKTLNITNPQNGGTVVEVYDAAGRLTLNKSFGSKENTIILDVEKLPKGIYIYKIGDLSSKFIKR